MRAIGSEKRVEQLAGGVGVEIYWLYEQTKIIYGIWNAAKRSKISSRHFCVNLYLSNWSVNLPYDIPLPSIGRFSSLVFSPPKSKHPACWHNPGTGVSQQDSLLETQVWGNQKKICKHMIYIYSLAAGQNLPITANPGVWGCVLFWYLPVILRVGGIINKFCNT